MQAGKPFRLCPRRFMVCIIREALNNFEEETKC